LKAGSQIQMTQPAFVLENLINKLFSSFASKPAEGGQGGAAASGSASSSSSAGKADAQGERH